MLRTRTRHTYPVVATFLLLSLILLTTSTALASSPLGVIGDADGSGSFDSGDVAFVEATLDAETAQTEQPYRLADVAHPCDGVIDAQDLLRLRRAANRVPRSDPILSECHGSEIGTAFEGLVVNPEPIPTIDDRFRQIAQVLPQFGGFYFDDNARPIVVLTEPDESLLDEAWELLIEHFGDDHLGEREEAVAVAGDFDFERLALYRDASHSILSHEAVVAIDIDERRNRLWIGIDDLESRDDVLEQIEGRYGVDREAVAIEKIEPWELQHEVNQNKIRPLQSGLRIGRRLDPGFVGFCTSGPIVNLGGVRGFLTNRHCTENQGGLDGNRFYQPQPVNNSIPLLEALQNRVGTEMADPANFTYLDNSDCPEGIEGYPYQCRYSDASFIAIVADITPSGIHQVPSTKGGILTSHHAYPYSGYRWTDTGVQYPFKGQTVSMMGGTSGQSTRKVTHTCLSVDLGDLNEGFPFRSLLCQYIAHSGSSVTIGGDSGSTVFVADGLVYATLAGIHWAGNALGDAVFSPLGGILADFGEMDYIFGNDPPTVTITQPAHQATVGSGNWVSVQFEADFWDPDHGGSCSGCLVEWHSNLDGFLGNSQVNGGTTVHQGQLNGPGTRTITATAFDTHGASTSDQIQITIGNFAPSVDIDSPSTGDQIWRDTTVQFQGHGYDNDLPGPLPCSSLTWTSSVGSDLQGAGCTPSFTFATLGTRIITLTGTDASNSQASDQILVNVIDPPTNAAPQVSITQPLSGAILQLGQSVQIAGFGDDPDDSSPLTYEWLIQGVGLISGAPQETIHSSVTADEQTDSFSFLAADFVKNNCGGKPFTLELRVTDGDNMIGAHQIPITVAGPVC